MAIWKKRPGETLQYTFDFAPATNDRAGAKTDWLATGETITAATVTADSGVVIEAYEIDSTGTYVTCRISGGTAGNSYTITCSCTTDGSQSPIREKELQIVPRYT